MFSQKINSSLIVIALFLTGFSMGCNKNENPNENNPGQTRYFLVGERTPKHGDTYVLPLTSETDIAKALKIIKEPSVASNLIVVAKIQKGGLTGEYANRDLLDGKKRIWSWRVTEFLGFADMTAEILDGWPGYVENNLDQWMHDTNGKIGFWTYTVLREVHISELR